MGERKDLRDFIGMKEGDTFARYLALIQDRQHVQWMPQTEFIFGVKGELLVDYIGRFERLTADAQEVFARLGVRCESLPHRRRSQRAPYPEYYDQHTKQVISRLYAPDIEIFKYTFDSRIP